MSEFGQNLLTWHDFFIALAGASAALLGLLFVGVSINLGEIAATERSDLRARAALAFSNLIFILIVSMTLLTPDPPPDVVALVFLGVALAALYRIVRNARVLLAGPGPRSAVRSTIRRISWTALADAILLFTAWRIWESNGQATVIVNLVGFGFVLLFGAADIAWEMLTEANSESR